MVTVQPVTKTKKDKDFIFSVGRRKESIARVRLFKGHDEHIVNGVPFTDYFPGAVAKILFERPFKVAGALDKYRVSVKVEGGGKSGQLSATVLGIARALANASPLQFRPPLKKQKLLTRDARIRERRKVGTGGKARRKKQSPKR
ncbi:MAG: 30S ribosomal protein S9 [Patescibacteria group bacterium]